MFKNTLLLDIDNKELLDLSGLDFIKTRKAILNSLGIKVLKVIRHYSLICQECNLHFQVNHIEYERGAECPNCKKLWKEGEGRGAHYIFKVLTKKELTPEKKIAIQFMMGDDPGRGYLSLLKLREGAPIFEMLFSKSISKSKVSAKCQHCRLRQNIMKLMKKDYKERF